MEEAVELIVKLWAEPRATFRGRYFQVEKAILEPKPAQKPHPPIMIAGGGEQMTLRAVARLADICNLLRGDYATIEKTHVQRWLLARNETALATQAPAPANTGMPASGS